MLQAPVGEIVWLDYQVRRVDTGAGIDVDDLALTVYPPTTDPIEYELDGDGTILFHDATGDYHALVPRSQEYGVWKAVFLPQGNIGQPKVVHWELMPITEPV